MATCPHYRALARTRLLPAGLGRDTVLSFFLSFLGSPIRGSFNSDVVLHLRCDWDAGKRCLKSSAVSCLLLLEHGNRLAE